MSKDKISDYSATANSNTDIGGINIDEGCAPSGINDAIRTLMKQLKDWQSGSQDVYIHPAGSASVPSITATGDTNTGLFFPAADTVGITTGGTERARFDSSGILGIGATPSAWASVMRAIQIGSGGSLFNWTGSNGSVTLGANLYDVGSGVNRYINSAAAAKFNVENGSFSWNTAASGTAGNSITFSTPMTLDASGNLALGTTSAMGTTSNRTVFTVNGTNDSLITMGVGGTRKGTFYHDGTNMAVGNDASGYLGFSANGSERARIDSSGNLLVGGTTARTRITLQAGEGNAPTLGTASGGAFFGNSNVTYGTLFGTSGSGYGWIQQQRVDGTGTAYDLCIQPSGGNLLVGTTTSTGRVTIQGTGSNLIMKPGSNARPTPNSGDSGFYSDAGYGDVIILGNTYGSGKGYMAFFYNQTEIGGISASSTSTVAYATSSDYRLKENIAPMKGALATVAQLKPVTYKWKSDGSDGQGFIAHELKAVMPDAVVGEKDAVDADGNPVYQGIDASFLVATLTAAIQELKAEFDAYKATHP